jgi:hypothetical protein
MSGLTDGLLAGAAGTALLNAATYFAYGAGVVLAYDALSR